MGDNMKTDIEIARSCQMEKIEEIAFKLGIGEKYLENYGKFKTKIDLSILSELKYKKDAKLILVTAITPTSAGEGKTTTTIGLGDAFTKLNKKVILALREPSLGPVFGIKGGASGGGYSQVVPMEDINLHFTGDMHALTSTNNLISACIDNHIFHGNVLNIDPNKVVWKRCLDMNDRALRIVNVAGGIKNGVPREDGFNITVASEVMAIMCLCNDLNDFGNMIDKSIIGYTFDGKMLRVKDLNITGSLKVLMKDAINPNLVQTLEHTPVLIHGGPFANIAHGCNSLIATKLALKLADYVITEAGFGADLGAEKFLNIKCRKGNLTPSAVVMVATIKALKMHGGMDKDELENEELEYLKKGLPNLKKHLENIEKFKLPVIVAINKFHSDSKKEIDFLFLWCKKNGYLVEICNGFAQGGIGAVDLAAKVIEVCQDKQTQKFQFLYDLKDEVSNKINVIAKSIYGAKEIIYEKQAKEDLEKIKQLDIKDLFICMAKTPFSLSDNPKLLGKPEDFNINVKEVKISGGVDFAVVITGKIMTMPGLNKNPQAEKINIDENGIIKGLF